MKKLTSVEELEKVRKELGVLAGLLAEVLPEVSYRININCVNIETIEKIIEIENRITEPLAAVNDWKDDLAKGLKALGGIKDE